MAAAQQITVNIINRNYPPNKGITGESASDLASFLSNAGVNINIITVSNSAYGGGGNDAANVGTVHGIKTFYNGKHKIYRLLASFVEGYRLIKRSRSLKADWTIVMTDPPLLNFFSSLLHKNRYKWILWSMDIYPDAFSAAGLLKDTNPVVRYIERTLRKYPPQAVLALGPVQRSYLLKKYYTGASHFELPCGIFEATKALTPPEWKEQNDQKIYLGYCGNIGEAHSLPFIKSVITNLDPAKFVLVLSLYGAKAEELRAFATGKEGIRFTSSVNRNQLSYIDIHLATLLEQWVNIAVPSKTVSSVCAGASFLYHGIADSDNWQLFKNAGWIIQPGDNLEEKVISFLNTVQKEDVAEKKQQAVIIARSLVAGSIDTYQAILQKVSE